MYYNQETHSRITIKTIANDGICNFVCDRCEIKEHCEQYNRTSEPDLNQQYFRMGTAREFLGVRN